MTCARMLKHALAAAALVALLACRASAHSYAASLQAEDVPEHEESSRMQELDTGNSAQQTAALPLSDGVLNWYTGVYVLRTVTLANGQDTLAHLIRVVETAGKINHLLEMDITNVKRQIDLTVPGTQIHISAYRTGVYEVAVQELYQGAATAALSSVDDSTSTGVNTVNTAALLGTPSNVPWAQTTTVTDMPTLFIISSVCDHGAAVSVEELSKVTFDGPDSKARTLEGYYSECSQGLSSMNPQNSRIVGPVNIPCSYTGPDYGFDANACTYTDSEGWMRYASQQAETEFGVDLSLYRHRVLLLPQYYIYSAGCRWMGLGTLGPDNTEADGAYKYASVWLTGELWKSPAAFMHELGHTLYLHHAAKGSCAYCDYSCVMGDCCDLRCFNPVHNWQLGWGKPIATLNTKSLLVGVPHTYTIPSQQKHLTNMLMIQPDWITGYNTAFRGYSIFIGYRTDTGKYDAGMPVDYTYATNIYWWDGQIQQMARYSYLWGSVGTGQEYRNATWGLSVRQVEGTMDNGTITVCRYSQAVETDCYDGIDNDCDGLIDFQDMDCIPGAHVDHRPDNVEPPRPPRPTSPPPGMPVLPPFPDSNSATPSLPSPPPPSPDEPPPSPDSPSPSLPPPPPPKKWPKKPRPPKPPPKPRPPKPPPKAKPPKPPPPPASDSPPPPLEAMKPPKPPRKYPFPPRPAPKSWAWKMSHRPPPQPPSPEVKGPRRLDESQPKPPVPPSPLQAMKPPKPPRQYPWPKKPFPPRPPPKSWAWKMSHRPPPKPPSPEPWFVGRRLEEQEAIDASSPDAQRPFDGAQDEPTHNEVVVTFPHGDSERDSEYEYAEHDDGVSDGPDAHAVEDYKYEYDYEGPEDVPLEQDVPPAEWEYDQDDVFKQQEERKEGFLPGMSERIAEYRRLQEQGVGEVIEPPPGDEEEEHGVDEIFAPPPGEDEFEIDEVFAPSAENGQARHLEEAEELDGSQPASSNPDWLQADTPAPQYVEEVWEPRSFGGRKLATIIEDAAGERRLEQPGEMSPEMVAAVDRMRRALLQNEGSPGMSEHDRIKYRWAGATEDEIWAHIKDPHRSDQDPISGKVAALASQHMTFEQLAQQQEMLQRWGQSILDAASSLVAKDKDGNRRGMSEDVQMTQAVNGADEEAQPKIALRYRFKLVRPGRAPRP